MIYTTVHLPTLYQSISPDDYESQLYMGACLRILEDMADDCVILLDAEPGASRLFSEIHYHIGQWAQPYGDKARELLKRLENRNRLIPSRIEEPSRNNLRSTGCDKAISIAKSQAVDAVLTPVACGCNQACDAHHDYYIAQTHYLLSEFYESRRKHREDEVSGPGWSKAKFEHDIWSPLFRHAKQVTIIDRWIGRKLSEKPETTSYAVAFGDFARGIKWVFEQFVETSDPKTNRRFEVVTEIRTEQRTKDSATGKSVSHRRSTEQLKRWHQVLKDFASELSRKQERKIDVQMSVYLDQGKHNQLRHARYLITDQLAYLVDPGFDMLDDSGHLSKLTMKREYRSDQIMQEISRLRRAPAADMESLKLRGRHV